MNADKDRLLFYIGTGLLIIAIIEVTLVPALLYRFLPEFIISKEFCTRVVGIIYALAFLFYALSDKYFAKQMKAVFICFLLFVFFQIYIQQNW